MNYLIVGPIRLRVSRKHLAPWGYALLEIGGLSFFSQTSGGDVVLASYHPRRSSTWFWSAQVIKAAPGSKPHRAATRRGQWNDYHWLPFGRQLVIARQDYHLRRA